MLAPFLDHTQFTNDFVEVIWPWRRSTALTPDGIIQTPLLPPDDATFLQKNQVQQHQQILCNDYYSKERETLQKMAFKYNDGNASERIWNVIEEGYLS